MKRPTKKEIQAKVEQLKDHRETGPAPEAGSVGRLESKKPNKNRIRKQGV